jgi:WhiB family redox-sensing transcriptional regulator
MSNIHWRDRAACKGLGTELFFPKTDDPKQEAKIAKAKSICAQCLVSEECFYESCRLGCNRSGQGIWGGLTPNQRQKRRVREGYTDPPSVPSLDYFLFGVPYATRVSSPLPGEESPPHDQSEHEASA